MASFGVEEVASAIFEATTDELEELQREQIFQGERSDGKQFVPSYAESTIKRKLKKGQPVDRVTLKDKGPFQERIFAKVNKLEITIDSPVFYTKYLVGRYKKVFGLNDKYSDIYRELIEADMIDFICKRFEKLA